MERDIRTKLLMHLAVSGGATDLSATLNLGSVTYGIERIAAHFRNVVSSLVDPFPRLRYKERPNED